MKETYIVILVGMILSFLYHFGYVMYYSQDVNFPLYYTLFYFLLCVIGQGGGVYLLHQQMELDFEVEKSEYTFDVIYVSTLTEIASMFSSWLWLLIFAIPAYACYKAWVMLVKPFLASRAAAAAMQEEDDASVKYANRAERRKAEKEERKKK
jgi:hypothetical protein